MDGIYALVNDRVFDQLVALLNSIEANYSKEIPVCVIPYDNKMEKVKAEVEKRRNCSIFSNADSIQTWEDFAKKAWSFHPNASENMWGRHKLGVHRKLCAFDGPFERFIFFDSDIIVMQPLDFIFVRLDDSDLVVYDFQHKDPKHVFNVSSEKLYKLFDKERIKKEIFCTGFFASKRTLIGDEDRDQILSSLRNSDSGALYPRAAEQSLLNYAVMKLGCSVYNFAIELPRDERTGNSVTSGHFREEGHALYDKGKRLTYLHYIGISPDVFKKVCTGENIVFPYRDIFLHYRYLHEPDKRPNFKGRPKRYDQLPGLLNRILRKIKSCIKFRIKGLP
jgi:hypothetical protein